MGTIQCAFFRTDQPYQKKQIGRKHEKKIMAGRRISGSHLSPLRSVSFKTTRSLVNPYMVNPIKKPSPIPG
ncbi:hypothetical protein F1880_007139 [Penicillium rolfsii]|nr:hypothetical protein F1880_007139 [Penicillium rolfsii]